MQYLILMMLVAMPYGMDTLPPTLPLEPAPIYVQAELTWYDPATCDVAPINCYNPARWWRMAAGHDARHWYNRALACPVEYPIGTVFVITGSRWGLADGSWRCYDRGGKIIINEQGVASLDLPTSTPIAREILRVQVIYPEE